MKPTVKHVESLVIVAAALAVGGQALASPPVSLAPVGPKPALGAKELKEGLLQVYSARQSAGVDPNLATFFWNIDFGKNEFLYQAAHTDYTIYGSDGKVFKRVRNARDFNDGTPAQVALPPGNYRVEAEAEDYPGARLRVSVPVLVEGGQTTAVHLGGDWRPGESVKGTELVRLPNGRPVGWHAAETAYASHPGE
jgi:hypothetical protein